MVLNLRAPDWIENGFITGFSDHGPDGYSVTYSGCPDGSCPGGNLSVPRFEGSEDLVKPGNSIRVITEGGRYAAIRSIDINGRNAVTRPPVNYRRGRITGLFNDAELGEDPVFKISFRLDREWGSKIEHLDIPQTAENKKLVESWARSTGRGRVIELQLNHVARDRLECAVISGTRFYGWPTKTYA